jgi:4-hydroxybenzoate polyprenyltransferase
MLKNIIISMRPAQWTKNLLVFAGPFFGRGLSGLPAFVFISEVFAVFCLVSSGSYIINDVIDREKDKFHPDKKKRPIASGKLSVRSAFFASLVLILTGIIWAGCLSMDFFLLIMFFILLHILYDIFLKHIPIIDVMVIACAFILRLFGGVIARPIGISLSSWILLCTFLLALFLALCKRRAEVAVLSDDSGRHRKSIADYNIDFLNQLITITGSCAILSYSIYALSPDTIAKRGTDKLVYTIPFVVYGIFRYLYLVHIKSGGSNPENLLLKDMPLLIDIILYGLIVYLVIYTH